MLTMNGGSAVTRWYFNVFRVFLVTKSHAAFKWKDAISGFSVSPGSAEALVRWGGKIKYVLIAYFLGNTKKRVWYVHFALNVFFLEPQVRLLQTIVGVYKLYLHTLLNLTVRSSPSLASFKSRLKPHVVKPNCITLARSELVRSWFEARFHYAIWFQLRTSSELALNQLSQLRTSFEPDSVMEFGREPASSC